MATVHDVARFFLANNPEGMTEEKLHILCAYAQAFSLALLDKPLFDEEIVAGEYPFIPALESRE